MNSANLIAFLKTSLPHLFTFTELQMCIRQLEGYSQLSDAQIKRLLASPKALKVASASRAIKKIYTYQDRQWSDLDLLQFWSNQPNSFISHYSAMYFQNLVEQKPNEHFISEEVVTKSHARSEVLNAFTVRQAFLKPARVTNRLAIFEKNKFYLVERSSTDCIGVERKVLNMEGAIYEIRISSVERTFIDCVISPHYAGGMISVVNAFKDASIDGIRLIDIYKRINPTYPYWQTVGLILEKLGHHHALERWRAKWEATEKIPFFIEREAKQSWIISSEWSVSYPGGLFANSGN